MSNSVGAVPQLAVEREGSRAAMSSPIPAHVGVVLCLLLAVGQVAWAGYQLGVGNQAIQIAFLKHWADPTLFANDDMVQKTLPLYPSYFFRMLAPLLHVMSLQVLYFTLHVLTTFFTLVAVYHLGRSIFRSHASGLAAVAILFAGHHHALAGDTLYSTGFTHTYVALPLALAALALAYRRHMAWAFAVAGVLFNLHALTGAYALLMLCAALLADAREMPARTWWRRTICCGVVSTAIAAPTLWQMLQMHQTFDANWLHLMQVRSADHSFPATWWETGNPDLPRFALFFALFALSWSFSPVRRADTRRAGRVSVWMSAAVLALFAAGYLFTEVYPVAMIIRLQPFRASRLLMVLMFIHIAHASVEGIRAGWNGAALTPEGSRRRLRMLPRVLEVLAGVLTLATLAVPSLLPLLPATVAVVTVVALCSGRLSWKQAVLSALALLVAILACRQIQFPLPLLSRDFSLFPHQWSANPLAIVALLAAIVFAILLSALRQPLARTAALAAALVVGASLAGVLFGREFSARAGNPNVLPIAQWARANTPKDALFLTPTGLSDFRILADRAIVSDWRDGTQLYFSASFAPDWFDRVKDLEPGIALSPDGTRLLSRGKPLDALDTDALVALARKYHASYILLPTPAEPAGARPLQVAWHDAHFTAYTLQSTITADIPKGVINPAQWLAAQKFMQTTVQQNIDKYRKADLTVQIVDPRGKPVQDLPILLNQTAHAFKFGCSLGFFEPNNINPIGDQKAAPVTPKELELFPQVFNASMIPFTSKWLYIERKPGEFYWNDLDKYVDYCTQHHIAIEYHFLAGLAPAWLYRNQQEQLKQFPAYAEKVVARYADRIPYWQVTNERHLLPDMPAVFKDLHAKYPKLELGMADCVKFYPEGGPGDMYTGVEDLIRLQKQGVKVDFFGIHGHRPYGLWADPRTMYMVMDRVAKLGVKLHITEMLLPLGENIIGPVRRGVWTPKLQADFLEEYLTVCFSHPAVELVNFWGLPPNGWGDSAGLLDANDNPRPAFERLKHLINVVWHTRVQEKLPLDGTIRTRAFHGTYELAVTLPGGKVVKATLQVPQVKAVALRYQLDPASGALKPLP